ncbi:MAG: hypothetical protein PHG32_09625 [Candidatus Cloacimonetes bacterium]|nr:hypothetical protein [Candidatus Cloacimonadota bacterium]
MKKADLLRRASLLAGIAILALTIFGCASVKHVNTSDETLDLSENSVLLLKFETSNTINTLFKPRINKLELRNLTTNKKYNVYFPYSGIDIGQSDKALHWLSVYLPAGYYKIDRVKGQASALLLNGNFDFPTTINFNLPPNSASYAGTISMTLRDINPDSGEVRAGSIFPLIDQTASGFGKGTFDISIASSQEDLKLFRLRKMALANADIVTDTATQP